mgnify:FL=1
MALSPKELASIRNLVLGHKPKTKCRWSDAPRQGRSGRPGCPSCKNNADESPIGNYKVLETEGLQQWLQGFCAGHRAEIFKVILNTDIGEFFKSLVKRDPYTLEA